METRRRPQLDKLSDGPSNGKYVPYMDKYRNTTNANTIRGAISRGVPLTGSASGVRSISSVDAFNTLGQFFVGEALGFGLAAGATKVLGFAAPKIGRALSGARPMTVAERSAAVTRAGRTGVGYIGQGNFKALQGSNYMGKSRYDLVYDEASRISRARPRPGGQDMSSAPFGPWSNNVPAALRRSGVSPQVTAKVRRTFDEQKAARALLRENEAIDRGYMRHLDGLVNMGARKPKRPRK